VFLKKIKYSFWIIANLFITVDIAQANVAGAYQAYQQKDYAQAIQLFEQSAHIGNVEAQLKLAVFYNQGVGVKTDLVMAYVYVSLAAEHGHEQAVSLKDVIFQKLNKTQQQRAITLWQSYHEKYGKSSLAENALPILRKKRQYFSPIKQLSRTSTVSQQRYAPVHNYLASSIFEFDVDSDGKVKDIEVAKNFYMSRFTTNNAMTEMLETKYRPAMITIKSGKKKNIATYGYRSVWAQRSITDVYVKENLPKFYRELKRLRRSAEAGNAYDQYQLAMFYLVFPALEVNRVRYVDYIKKSAEAGVPEAQLEYASLLLKGAKVTYDADKAIQLTLTAAQAGNARAQYKLARHFLSGQLLEKNEHKAHFWLEKAVAQNEPYAKYWLARLSLISKNKQYLNPEMAKRLLLETGEIQENNPNWFYYSALAEHQGGNHDDAKDFLEEGLKQAKELAWNIKMFKKLAIKLAAKS
jgi:TPR repeat protein